MLKLENSYATHSDILSYLQTVVSDYNLDSCVKFSHRVIGAFWEADKGRWRVRIQPHDDPNATFDDYAEILINATGILKYVETPIASLFGSEYEPDS